MVLMWNGVSLSKLRYRHRPGGRKSLPIVEMGQNTPQRGIPEGRTPLRTTPGIVPAVLYLHLSQGIDMAPLGDADGELYAAAGIRFSAAYLGNGGEEQNCQ